MASAIIIVLVVPSPACKLVEPDAFRRREAPNSSNLFYYKIRISHECLSLILLTSMTFFATVTPSFVIRGNLSSFSMHTFLPYLKTMNDDYSLLTPS